MLELCTDISNFEAIRVLEGLESLQQLRSLWIARNLIEHIGEALDQNVNLVVRFTFFTPIFKKISFFTTIVIAGTKHFG
jgi:hypothetical protein